MITEKDFARLADALYIRNTKGYDIFQKDHAESNIKVFKEHYRVTDAFINYFDKYRSDKYLLIYIKKYFGC